MECWGDEWDVHWYILYYLFKGDIIKCLGGYVNGVDKGEGLIYNLLNFGECNGYTEE